MDRVLASPLFTPIVPSRLDRARMDRIAARPQFAQELGAMLGESRVHLRGKGGAGKTVLLLQAAREAFEREQKRCLVLTYNHALAADIQRLLALMGIPAMSEAGGIEVRTVMSFTYSWLSALGLLEPGEDPAFEDYERRCREAHRYVVDGVITPADLQAAREAVGGQFGFDAVIVDEAQDWPQAEADLVCALYGGEAVSIADGVDQLVRGSETDWKRSVGGKKAAGFHFLGECLRMKANLAVFANAIAARAGLSWQVSPSTEAGGGRIIVASGAYSGLASLRNELVSAAKAEGNSEIDFLHCVPPSGVGVEGNHRVSELSKVLQQEGRDVWDGVDAVLRRDYPRSVSQLRIVQYESCRGLEGWVTVLDGLDEFWSRKRAEALHELRAQASAAGAMSLEVQAGAIAWRWVMIALTRPIDTLVITIKDTNSEAGKLLMSAATDMPDLLEVL